MQDPKKKVKRVQPLLRARKAQFDHESSVLIQIRAQKVEAERLLQVVQREYVLGVDRLNKERQSANLQILSVLELGLDGVKQRWYKTLQVLREIERREGAQLAQVLNARRNLDTAEKLEERYSLQARIFDGKKEQKLIDEMALRKYRIDG